MLKPFALGLLVSSQMAFGAESASLHLNIKQATMLQTLNQVITAFSEEYAPIEFKFQDGQINLAQEVQSVRNKIVENPNITDAQFQDLLVDLVEATRDFHTQIIFNSTEKATLPFLVMPAQGRYFVTCIDRKKLTEQSLPDFTVGTEILSFSGRKIGDVVRELVPQRYKGPSPSELRLATEVQLVQRYRALGMNVPRGHVDIQIPAVGYDPASQGGPTRDLGFEWEYTRDYVPHDIPPRNMFFDPASTFQRSPELKVTTTDDRGGCEAYTMGGSGFVPALGTDIGSIASQRFPNHIYRLPERGPIIGFVRIPTFSIEKDEEKVEAADEFGQIVSVMDEPNKTDLLVIDITHNLGGSVAYMYGLLSRLTDYPLKTLPHRIMVSSEMVMASASRLERAPFVRSEEDARIVTQGLLPGMVVDFTTWLGIKRYDQMLLDEYQAGRRLTQPTALLGLEYINPHPKQRYTKKILVLVDELDFSAGDFFPATLQDTGRATILGQRTAGAGGAVKETPIINQFNIQSLRYTYTIAQRLNGDPLENRGVTPDIPYEFTVQDMTNNFVDYRQAIISAIQNMLK
ncbi:MAG: protease-like activity factor CPAF [Bdellovibrio sp.]|nr:MAG: protease-like activity factor CPAF [Bdellovibrio sp.]